MLCPAFGRQEFGNSSRCCKFQKPNEHPSHYSPWGGREGAQKGNKSEDLPLFIALQIRFRDKSADENLKIYIQPFPDICCKV
jgi:hypothetical protein